MLKTFPRKKLVRSENQQLQTRVTGDDTYTFHHLRDRLTIICLKFLNNFVFPLHPFSSPRINKAILPQFSIPETIPAIFAPELSFVLFFTGKFEGVIKDPEPKFNKMVQMREFRIVMPLALEEFQIAQMYMVMKMQQQNTTGAEGVEVLENRAFEDDQLGKGQYTLKIYRFQSKAPTWLAKFAPTGALVMQEEAWNAYPRCKSVIKCPYFTRFILTIDTIHKADHGLSENVHGLTKEKLAIRQVEMLDIATYTNDYWSYVIGSTNIDFSQFKSTQTGRGPLLDGWQDQCNPVMTAYKLVTIDAPYWGFGGRLELALVAGERALFLESHRNCLSWMDEWFGLTLDMMRELEKQSDSSLNEKLGRNCVMAEGVK